MGLHARVAAVSVDFVVLVLELASLEVATHTSVALANCP